MIAEFNPGGTLLHRHIHGLGAGDDPLVSYTGSSTALGNARFLYADIRGSIVMRTDQNGNNVRITNYDEYGVHGSNAPERFGYTGQAWVPEIGLYYYKARMYAPGLGRFMQTDPIGYADGMNLYAYVGNDPVNGIDPSGLRGVCVSGSDKEKCERENGTWFDIRDDDSRTNDEIVAAIAAQIGWQFSAWFSGGVGSQSYIGVSGGFGGRTRGSAGGFGIAGLALTPVENDRPCPKTSAGDLATAVGHAETAHSAFEELADIENGGKYLRPIGVAGSVVSSTATAVDSAARGETKDVTFARIVLPAIGGIAGGALGAVAGSLGGPVGTAAGGIAGGAAGAALGDYLANLYAADAPRLRSCR